VNELCPDSRRQARNDIKSRTCEINIPQVNNITMAKTKINADDIADLLKAGSGYISGEEIARRFGVTRAAVWKAIRALKENGYIIESSRSKGYKLLRLPDLCVPELKSLLAASGRSGGHEIFFFDTLASTNMLAMEMAAKGCSAGSVVIADSQTSGKGRLGRTWFSPAGRNLYLSMVVRPNIPPGDASILTMLSAVACATALNNYCGLPVSIKWPNDLLAGNRKIAGILAETRADIDRIYHAVIGIGINVNLSSDEMPAEISALATSLFIETGKRYMRTGLAAEIISEFDRWYELLLISGKIIIADRWSELSSTIGQNIRLAVGDLIYEGTAEGIDEDGLLILRLHDGTCRKFSAGDVTVPGASR
jgi:BirA family transcriptional regulator, biotin operon repressor / biotin---[acetyl-CoA-carboxylase] ligase